MLIRLTNIASSYIVTPINVVMALWSQWFMFSEVAKAIASKFCIRVGIRCQGCWHVVNLWPVPDFNWRSEGDGKPDYFYAQRCGDFRFFTSLRCVRNDRVKTAVFGMTRRWLVGFWSGHYSFHPHPSLPPSRVKGFFVDGDKLAKGY